MTAADAFLAAIIAAPADDLPRLVYADYLDEHGDPDRAEFIRLQVARGHGGRPAERERNLLAANRARWELPGLQPAVQTFRRGFVEALHIAAEVFVAHADRIGRSAPVTTLRLTHSLPVVAALARVPWLSRLEELDLTGNIGIGGWLDGLLAAVPLPNIRALELRYNQLGADVIDVLSERAAGMPRLTRLNLSGNPIGDDGVAALADSAPLGGLTELVLRCEMIQFNISVHANGASALAGSRHLTRLRHLDLAGHYIGDAGLRALVESPNAGTLEYLDVSNNELGELGDSGVEAVVGSPHLGRLRVLDLSKNRLGRLGAEVLAGWPRLGGLDTVNLAECEMPESARTALLASRHADRFRLDEPTVTV